MSKKRKIRNMRKGQVRKNPDGSVSTHLMADSHHPENKKKPYTVFPTIAPKKGKENSTDFYDWVQQDEFTAGKRDETINFKSEKRAQKMAHGAWKQGRDKKEAMKHYKNSKKKK